MIAEAQAKSTNDKVRYQWELLLGPRYCGSILQKPVNEITTLDVERVLRPVWRAKPETGRKLLVRLRRVFDYARVHLRDRHGIICRATRQRGRICAIGVRADHEADPGSPSGFGLRASAGVPGRPACASGHGGEGA